MLVPRCQQFQEKCCRTNNLTLANAIETAQGYESCAQNMNLLNNPASDVSIKYTERRMGPRSTQQNIESNKKHGQCRWCGVSCESKESSRVKGKQCRNCDKLKHFASVCRSSKQNKGPAFPKKSITQIDERENESQNRYSINSTEYSEYLRYKQGKSYGLFAVGISPTRHNNDGPRASIEMNKTSLSFQIDTGAPINVIDEPTYHSIHNRPHIHK